MSNEGHIKKTGQPENVEEVKKPVQKPPEPPENQIRSAKALKMGEGAAQIETARDFELEAPQEIHVGPSGKIKIIIDELKKLDPANNLYIGYKEDSNGVMCEDMKKFNLVVYPILKVPKGKRIRLQATGPNADEMMMAVTVAFRDNFQKKGLGYIEGLNNRDNEVGRWFSEKLADVAELDGSSDTFQDKFSRNISQDPQVRYEKHKGRYIPGGCAHSGVATYGHIGILNEPEYGENLAEVSKKARVFEEERLDYLKRGLHERVKAIREGKDSIADLPDSSIVIERELPFFDELIDNAKRTKRVERKRVLGQEIDLPGTTKRLYPNAELSIEVASHVSKIDDEDTQQKHRGLVRTLMQELDNSNNRVKISEFILNRLAGKAETAIKFKRAGIFLLENNHLVSPCEYTENGFRQIGEQAVIPVDRENDGTAYVARMALKTSEIETNPSNRKKLGFTYHTKNVREDPNTCEPTYFKYNEVAWSGIFDPTGRVLGVLWVDNMDEKPIQPGDLTGNDGLEDHARLAGEILSRRRKTKLEITEVEKPTIAVMKNDPTYLEILEMKKKGYIGVASEIGTEKCHGVIFAGSLQFPTVVGLKDLLKTIREKEVSEGLLLDPVDGQGAFIFEPDKHRTVPHFSIDKMGDYASLEPPVGEIRDAVTNDGHRVRLKGTFDGITSATLNRASKYGVEGAGLVRTEVCDIQYPVTYSLTNTGTALITLSPDKGFSLPQAKNLVSTLDLDMGEIIDVVPPDAQGKNNWMIKGEKGTLHIGNKNGHAKLELETQAGREELDVEMAFLDDSHRPGGMHLMVSNPYSILEEHYFQRYKKLVQHLHTQSPHNYNLSENVIRLQDVTGEKYCQLYQDSFGPDEIKKGEGIRFLINHEDIARSNLRALARVAKISRQPVGCMIPQADNVENIGEIVQMLDVSKKEVDCENEIPVFAQIESVEGIKNINKIKESSLVDGFGFGTNDLTVSVTKRERSVAEPLEFSPKVVKTLKEAMDNVGDFPAIFCGALTQTPEGVTILVGLGADNISARPESLPHLRDTICSISKEDAKKWVDEILSNEDEWDHSKVKSYMSGKIPKNR